MDFREEILATWRRAYQENPGLESFKTWKKRLLWGIMLLFALQKLTVVASMWRLGHPGAMIFGAVMGMAIPGIFVLAVWRGNWKFSLALLLPAFTLASDVIRNGLPALTSGNSYYPIFYVIIALEGFMTLYIVGVVLWISVPVRNRQLGEIMNQVNEHLIRRSKELTPPPAPQA